MTTGLSSQSVESRIPQLLAKRLAIRASMVCVERVYPR